MVTHYGRTTPAQGFALGVGVVYMLIGLIGFGVTGFNGWFDQFYAEKLMVFPLNGIHNLVHIVIGLVWMMSSSTFAKAKRVNLVLGVALGVVALLGFAGLAKWLAIEGAGSPDNYLHLITALASIYLGLAGATGRLGRS